MRINVKFYWRDVRKELRHQISIETLTGRRNGRQPNEKMQQVLKKTIEDARAMTSKVNKIQSVTFHIALASSSDNELSIDTSFNILLLGYRN